MGEKSQPDISVEYSDGVMEDFEDVKSYDVSGNSLTIEKEDHIVNIPVFNIKRFLVRKNKGLT